MPDGPASKAEPLAPGTRIAHYEILRPLGQGGMGRVYKARDLKLGRHVALKHPLQEMAGDRKERKRFLREASSASSLSHPNIVQIYEVFTLDDLPWIAMEFVDGATLRAHLARNEPPPLDEILELSIGMADGLQAAHAGRILHRDLNPRNILIDRSGRPRITDFGLARIFVPAEERSEATTQSSEVTGSGAIVGTMGYMSPEQALGRLVDPRSDIFSLGAVIYEICTGHPAFTSSSRGDALDAVLHREPQAIGALNYEIPEDLARVVRKCLAKRAEERYQSCTDLLVDLRALRRRRQSGESLAAAVPAPVPSRWRRPAVWAVALLTLVAAGVILARWSNTPEPLQIGSPAQVTSTPGWEDAPVLSPDGQLIAYSSEVSGNHDIWIIDMRGGMPLQTTRSPASDGSPSWFPDGSALAFVSDRSETESIWKVPKLGGTPTLLVPDALDPAVSPDGKQIAFARPGPSADLRIFVAPLSDVTRARMLTDDGHGLWDHRSPAWSPDGSTICYSAFRDLWLVPLDGTPPRRLTTDEEADADPVWSPRGERVYFSSFREGTLAIWRVSTRGGDVERVTLGSGPESHPSISGDGERLVYTTLFEDPDIVIRDLHTGEERTIQGSREDASPSIRPDGAGFAFVSNRWAGRYDIWYQELSGVLPAGEPRRITDHPGSAQHPAFSPDGQWIAYWRVLEGERDVWVMPSAGGPPGRITEDPAPDIHPEWSPDGSQLAFASERAGGSRIWKVAISGGAALGDPQPVTSGETTDMAPAWSPDGSSIAYIAKSGSDDEAWLVDPADPSTARQVTHSASARRVRWDPASGDLLVSGLWGEERTILRRIDPATGSTRRIDPPVHFGRQAVYTDFDLSPDGRILVYSRARKRGDIWILESGRGSF